MRAKDLMTTKVSTVTPDTPVRDVAALLLREHVTDIPVADDAGRVLGIVGETELVHRIAAGDDHRWPWWLGLFASQRRDPTEFTRVHGLHAKDVMAREVVSVTEETSMEEVAHLLEERGIRRLPVLRDDRLVGMVSRSDLLRVLVAAAPDAQVPVSVDDQALRGRIMNVFESQAWANTTYLNVVVTEGVVHLSGFVYSDAEREALRAAAEEVPGVKGVENRLVRLPHTYLIPPSPLGEGPSASVDRGDTR